MNITDTPNFKRGNLHQRNAARARRQADGNILILACVSFAVVSLALMIGFSFTGLFFVNNRLQASADEIALAGAKKLNDKDRIGQMNNMVARCRQLVFSTRKEYEKTKKDFPNLESFAEPLLIESQDSARTLDTERQYIGHLARQESTDEMQNRFNEIKKTYAMRLPWLQVEEPRMNNPEFGKVFETESNVEELKQINELQQHDENMQHITKPQGKGLHLYKANEKEGLKLPDLDGNLPFKLSSLPAPIDRTISPARIILQDKLNRQLEADCTPSALQVSLKIKVETGIGFYAGGEMMATSAATTTGAGLQQ